MFHHFPEELGQADLAVHSLELTYRMLNGISSLSAVRETGYIIDPADPAKFFTQSRPWIRFEYTAVSTTVPPTLGAMAREHFGHLPLKFVDLNGDGIPGTLARVSIRGISGNRTLDMHPQMQQVPLLRPVPSCGCRQTSFLLMSSPAALSMT